MSHLLLDTSADVQKMTYHLLSAAAKKRTEHLVIEAGVDVESTMKINLPNELIAILQIDLSINDAEGLWQEQVQYGDFCDPAYLIRRTERFWLSPWLDVGL
jgi:E3 ubiquitin-protein ligase listerin